MIFQTRNILFENLSSQNFQALRPSEVPNVSVLFDTYSGSESIREQFSLRTPYIDLIEFSSRHH
jgi:hypothetical protein